jgi:hypothetical protein
VSPAAWHALLGPLPPGTVPRKSPVASPELVASGRAEAVAGWEDLMVALSAGPEGLRIVQVLLDGERRLLGASDHVLYRDASVEPVRVRQESLGGRFEPDGTFTGTRWVAEGPEPGADAPGWHRSPRVPSEGEVTGLRALVAEVLRLGATGEDPEVSA